MKIPPLVIGFSLLIWGLETQRLFVAVLLALCAESCNFIAVRYDFQDEDYIKISDLTSLVFLAGVTLIMLNYKVVSFLRITTEWLPLFLMPLLMAQVYSSQDYVVIGTRLGRKRKTHKHKPFDIRGYYIFTTFLAGACANSGSVLLFAALLFLFFTLAFVNRGKGYSFLSFILVFTVVMGCAYLLQRGVDIGYHYAKHKARSLMSQYYQEKYNDPYMSSVNFGDTGRLKTSGKIILRLQAKNPPERLRVADFSVYSNGKWAGNAAGFTYTTMGENQKWQLLAPPENGGLEVFVQYDLPKEKGVVPVPPGSFSLQSETVYALEQNRSGSLRVADGAPIISYTVAYAPNMFHLDDKPQNRHLYIPEEERYLTEKIRGELKGADDEESLARIRTYLASGFTYSLEMLGKGSFPTPLGNFLFYEKKGFCEYYATATALLLRSVGIASRYVVGYVVVEQGFSENSYVVRKRHGHAWCEAYINGKWITVDTTPVQWLLADADEASFFEPVGDFINYLQHRYRLYQIGEGRDYTLFFSVVVVILTLFLALRIYRRTQLQKKREGQMSERRQFQRTITPFTPVVDSVVQYDKGSRRSQCVSEFAARAAAVIDVEEFDRDEFSRLYRLHLKKRFDSAGLKKSEEDMLTAGARKYLARVTELPGKLH